MLYTVDDLPGRHKTRVKPWFSLIWHGISIFTWLILYYLFDDFSRTNNQIGVISAFFVCVIILGLLQELLISRVLKIFPYWTFIFIIGIFVGLVYGFFFLVSSDAIVLLTGILSIDLGSSLGRAGSVVVLAIVVPGAAAIVLIFYTYFMWHKIIKPIHTRVSERMKIIMTGMIVNGFAIFLTFTLCFALLVVLRQNLFLASFLSIIFFSFLTYSGFSEILTENSISHAFEIKNQ